jgi:hypothetical protein
MNVSAPLQTVIFSYFYEPNVVSPISQLKF